jgi:hypothetical protein
MKAEEREHMYKLCAMIETEKDHKRFLKLMKELNDLLMRKERRLDGTPSPDTDMQQN